MFCRKCGCRIEGDQNICQACAADPEQEAKTPPVAEKPTFTLNDDTSAPKKPEKKKKEKKEKKAAPKKSRKKLALILGILGGVLAALLVLTIIFWPYVSSFCRRSFMSPEKYLTAVEQDALEQDATVDMIGGLYDQLLNRLKNTAPTEYSLSVNFTDQMMQAIESFSEGDLQLDWLDKLQLTAAVSRDGQTAGAGVQLTLNDTQVLNADLFLDIAEDMLYAAAPELNETYLAQSADLSLIELYFALDAEALPDSAAVKTLLRKYALMAVEKLENVEKRTETLQLDTLSKKVTVLRGELPEEAVTELLLQILEDAKEDETARALLKALCDAFNTAYDTEFTPETLLEDMKAWAKDRPEEFSGDLVVETYVDMTDRVLGHSITSDDEKMVLRSLRIDRDNTWEQELEVGEDIFVRGSGETADGTVSADYNIRYQDKSYLHCKLEGMDEAALAAGELRGNMELILGEALIQKIAADYVDPSMLGLVGMAQPTLKLKLGENTADMSLMILGSEYATATLTAKTTEHKPQKPEKWTETTNLTGMIQWLYKTDFDKLTEALRQAKVPEDYVGAIEGLLGGLDFGFGW